MLCAIAIIDPAARARLMKLEEISKRFGLFSKAPHGHITLATYTGNEEERFISSCKEILSGHKKFPVCYHEIQVWTAASGARSVIVAVPRKEGVLASIQKEIYQGWAADLNQWTQADAWNPHTTLLYVPNVDLDPVAQAMREEFVPFMAQVTAIEFSHVYENGYMMADVIELQ